LGPSSGLAWPCWWRTPRPARAVAAPERERVAVLTASPPGSQPPAWTAASSPDPGNGNVSSVNQRTQAADQRTDKAKKNSQGRRDKPDTATSKDKPGKGKDK
jgi:hypothetical protein